MKSSEIIARARGVSDLANVTAITHDDETGSLNESYKDLYAELTDRDDDYYLIETTIVLTAAMRVAGSVNEYLVPLPDDFYTLRWVDYMGNTRWERMERFPLNMKNDETGAPMYRFQANRLWIICGNAAAFAGSIRVGYYPVAAALTVPEVSVEYVEAEPYATRPLIISPFYTPTGHTMLYIDGAGALTVNAESEETGVTSLLYTSPAAAALSNLVYYKRYFYFIRLGNVWRGTTNLVTAGAPAAIHAIGTVTNFSIWGDVIYFTYAGNTASCNLDGTGFAVIVAAALGDDLCRLTGTTFVYHTAANEVRYHPGAMVLLASGITHVVSDGTTLWVVDTLGNLRKITLTALAVTADEVVEEDVLYLGNWNLDWLALQTNETQITEAHSTLVDTDLTYPVNALFETMAYQCAVDFRVKQNADPSLQATRLEQLRGTLLRQLRRDEYAPERIRNAY